MIAGFIGAGKVGFSLGKYFAECGVPISGYYSQNAESARKAAEFTGTNYYGNLESITKDSDTLFITVPDDSIGEVWKQMRNLPIKNKNICHCSGSVSSTVFFDAAEKGAYRYSIHPLYAISDKYNSYANLKEAVFSIEGSNERMADIMEIFAMTGNHAVTIEPEKKKLYHCAAVMASNHIVALAALSTKMLEDCGFPPEAAEKALAPLITGNAESVGRLGAKKALTGPVERGDCATVENHLKILNEETREIYRMLSRVLVDVAEEKHPERNYEIMKKELEK